MSLRRRAGLALGLLLVAILAVAGPVTWAIVMDGFARREAAEVREETRRALRGLADEIERLDAFARDWASWDEMYAFAESGDPRFLADNVDDQDLVRNGLHALAILRLPDRLLHGRGLDRAGRPGPLPAGLRDRLTAGSPLVAHPGPTAGVRGVLPLPEGPLLVASRPIVTSAGAGPARGAVVMARRLDAEVVERLAARVGHPVTVGVPADPALPRDVRQAGSALGGPGDVLVRPDGTERIAGYAGVPGLDGATALLVRVVLPREIHAQGRLSVLATLGALVGAVLAVGLAGAAALRRWVLDPVERLGRDVDAIAASGDPVRRVSAGGPGELGRLAAAVNGMLEALAGAQGAVRRSEEYFRSLTQNAMDLIVVLRVDGTIVYESPSVEPILGYDPAARVGRSVADTLHPDDAAAALALLGSGRERGETGRPVEFRVRHRDGTWRVLAAMGRVIRDPAGAPLVVVNARDVTGQKRAAEERERLIAELQAALARVKTLSGLLPICAWCKRIRDDRGYWQQVEVYVRDRSDADFTHGMCPDCVARMREGGPRPGPRPPAALPGETPG